EYAMILNRQLHPKNNEKLGKQFEVKNLDLLSQDQAEQLYELYCVIKNTTTPETPATPPSTNTHSTGL
ncbi:unnamed protein product, partial [Didymodactylos carnosus]